MSHYLSYASESGETVPEEPIAGRYELIEEIGSGGMGAVWRGYDAVLDREVAVKRIRHDEVMSPEAAEHFAQRFTREARVTARIRHHGVPQVYDAVLESSYDQVYLVMELVRGVSLRAFIDPNHPLPIAWAAAMAAQVGTVLSHAHSVPVVHRDLKPDNVLVADDGTVKVLDFGIAAILRKGVTKLTVAGTYVGTAEYMAPEQVRCAKVTPRTDLYALGCLLHELLCGRPLFDGPSDFDFRQQHVSAPPRPLRELRPDVPPELEKLVLELLRKNPERRPTDAYAVYERLLPFLPPPGSSPPAADGRLRTVPDPTLMYRRPNAPRPQGEEAPTVPDPTAVGPSGPPSTAPDTGLRDAIKGAVEHANTLLEGDRFSQAAQVLQDVITPAANLLGLESPRVLWLRMRRALILQVGEDTRRALAEFDALAAAYVRAAGKASPEALECRRMAAYCRAELGQATAALRQFREVLDRLRSEEGDVSPTARDVRKNIALVLLSEGDIDAAIDVLEPLHQDLCLVNGLDDEETKEIEDILFRARGARD
ncbi:serine/threonine protein kinase PkaE [Nocardiopsis rhodophaea]|uniref:non-specific serine/threonine protein kinase n=1 Tax=Nocardiopsis rhodophaea TaxID=280238 RepID=A0ABP5EZZ7_9ACTN